MKHLMLLRHGEASALASSQEDRDRVLTRAGIAASKKVGAYIAAQGPVPDVAMCSAARNASAIIVIVGWPRPEVTMLEPSQIKRFEIS